MLLPQEDFLTPNFIFYIQKVVSKLLYDALNSNIKISIGIHIQIPSKPRAIFFIKECIYDI